MNKTYFYLGHHKCATRYMISILNEVNNLLGLSNVEFHNDKQFGDNLMNYLNDKQFNFIYYTNAKYNKILPLINSNNFDFKGFHLVRDPRDIIISGYFSHKNSHPTKGWPELIKYREKLKNCSIEEGIKLEIEYNESRFSDLLNWDYTNKHIFEYKYEDLILNPYKSIIDMLDFLGLIDFDENANYSSIKYTGKLFTESIYKKVFQKNLYKYNRVKSSRLIEFIYKYDFKKLSNGRKIGDENNSHHYRKGISGDWKNYFNDSHKSLFKEKYQNLLLKLEYEKDNKW